MKSGDPIIRFATPNDVDQLLALMLAFARFDGSEDEVTVTRDELIPILSDNESKLNSIVIEVDYKLVGFLNYFISYSSFSLSSCLWVEDVYIAESFRSRGLGQRLFYYVKEQAERLGCKKLEWLVRRNNSDGIAFYKKLGAKVDEGTIYVSWKI